jgi:putative ABC transport system permease protein
MVAVALVLLIGCVNLVNLLFARHTAREREFAVRLAMGARRARLIRQLCTESLLLGLFGGAAGLLLSLIGCGWIRTAIAAFLQRIGGGQLSLHLDISADWRVLAYSAAISILTGVAVGLWPAVKASRGDLHSTLKQAVYGRVTARRKRSLLIGAQVAACLMLLAGAGLLFRGVWRSADADPGFDIRHVAIVGVNLKLAAETPQARAALLVRAIERIEALPEVASVASADRPPFLGHGTGGFKNERNQQFACLFNLVSPRYFESLDIPLLSGRTFTAQEIATQAPVAVISMAAAQQAWPGQDPIGHAILGLEWARQEGQLPHDRYAVIGVAKSVRSTYLSKQDEPYLYFPKPVSTTFGSLLVRTRVLPDAAAHSVMRALGAVHPDLPSQTFMVALDQAPLEVQRLMAAAPAVVAGALGMLALLLASLGVFGLVSQLVVQQTREIAIRVSLGAQNRDVIGSVMGQTIRPVAIGAAFGLAGALGISFLLKTIMNAPDMPDLTYGAGAFDPLTFIGVLAMLATVVAIASFAPVRHATRISPADALRFE